MDAVSNLMLAREIFHMAILHSPVGESTALRATKKIQNVEAKMQEEIGCEIPEPMILNHSRLKEWLAGKPDQEIRLAVHRLKFEWQ